MGFLAEKAWDIVAGIIMGIWESLIGPFDDLHGLKTLVFNRYEDGEKVYGTFTAEQLTSTIAPGVQSMSYIVGFFLVLGIIFMGSKISNAGLNPSNRTMFIEFVRDWIIVVLVVSNIGLFYEMVYMLNSAVVALVNGELIDNLEDKLMPDLADAGLVGWIIIGLFMLGVTVWANFYYIMREITLMVFMILGPIFVALFIFPSQKGVTLAWFKEFFGTVMIQSVHAVTLFTIATAAGTDLGVIQMTLMYLVVIPTGEAIRGLLNLGGDTTGRLGKFGAMAGMAGISGIYGAVKSATSGKGFAESLRKGVDGVRGSQSGESATGAEGTTGAVVGAAAGTDSRSSRMLRAGEIMSVGGKMLVGSAGSIAGSVMGPQGALIGGGLGTAIGGTVGGMSGRLGFAAKDKLSNALSKDGVMRNALQDGMNAAKSDSENDKIASNLADLQTQQWAAANKNKFMKDFANDPDKENKWNQKLAEQRKFFKDQNKAKLQNGTFDNNYAKASDLGEQYAQEKLKESLSKNGRDAFVARLPENMSQDEINDAWKNEKENRLNNFRKQGQLIAKSVVGNKPTDSFVSKDDFLKQANKLDMDRFDQTESQFKNNYQKHNPTASQQEIDGAWNEARSNHQSLLAQRGQNIAKNTNSAIPNIGRNDRKASDLVASTADAMTKNWAQANEKAFKEKLHQSGIQNVEKEVETAWQQKLAQVKNENIQKAEAATNNWANANGAEIKSGLQKASPQLSPQEIDKAYQSMVDGKLQENLRQADADTASWAQANKQAVTSSIRQETIQGLGNKIDAQWKDAVKQQSNQNYDYVSGIAQQVTGGQSLSAFVDKDKFKQAVVGHRIEQAKAAVLSANPHMTPTELNQAVGKQASYIEKETSSAISSVSQLPLSKGYGTRTALAAQYASQATDLWANNPDNRQAFETKFKKDFDAVPDNAALQQSNPNAYQSKLSNAMGQRWQRTVNDQYSQNLKSAEDAMIVDTSSNGVVLPNTSGIVVGMKAFKNSLGNNSELMIGKNAFLNAPSGQRYSSAVRAVYDHRYGEDTPAEVKAKAYRDDVSYRAGVLRGVKGYQKKATQVMSGNNNPYARQMYESAYELSDIARMAQTETINLPNGQQQTKVAQGAVQMVVEKNRSYLQVKTKDGSVKTVSQYGAGDSSLEDGTTLFKDYNIDNGELSAVPSRNGQGNGFYAKDTAGYKVAVGRRINMDANDLLQSRRHIINQESEPYHDAYNYRVDQGNFNLNDIKTNSSDKKAILVVEQNRSYVAMRGDDEKLYRVSPVQDIGNSNLNQGQVVYKEFVVEGGQLRERSIDRNIKLRTYMNNSQGQQVDVDSSQIPDSINVNEYVLAPKNKRHARRQQIERSRTKSGAYL